MTDAELACRAADGDELAFRRLCRRYRALMEITASKFYAPGLDRDDLLQEARLGLWGAVRSFDPARSFGALAAIAVQRRVIEAVRRATRGKHRPVSQGLSMPEQDWLEIRGGVDPLDAVLDSERLAECIAAMERLSPRQRTVAQAYLNTSGERNDYDEVCEALGLTYKQVDNALANARRRIAAALTA